MRSNMGVEESHSMKVMTPVEVTTNQWTPTSVFEYRVKWLVHLWQIPNPSTGKSFKSKTFPMGSRHAYIDLFIRGDSILYDDDVNNPPVSVYLCFRPVDYPLKGKLKIVIDDDAVFQMAVDKRSEDDGLRLGCHKICTHKSIRWQETIEVECTMYVVKDSSSTTVNSTNGYSLQLVKDFGSLLETGKFSDIVIKTGESELRAHKNILSARSPVFAAMFDSDLSENKSNVVHIKDVDVTVMRQLLRHIYTGRLDNLGDSVEGLLVAADKYGLEDLKKQCFQALGQKISVDSVANLLYLADRHRESQIIRKSFSFMKRNWEAVQRTEGWRDLKRSQRDLAYFVESTMSD